MLSCSFGGARIAKQRDSTEEEPEAGLSVSCRSSRVENHVDSLPESDNFGQEEFKFVKQAKSDEGAEVGEDSVL